MHLILAKTGQIFLWLKYLKPNQHSYLMRLSHCQFDVKNAHISNLEFYTIKLNYIYILKYELNIGITQNITYIFFQVILLEYILLLYILSHCNFDVKNAHISNLEFYTIKLNYIYILKYELNIGITQNITYIFFQVILLEYILLLYILSHCNFDVKNAHISNLEFYTTEQLCQPVILQSHQCHQNKSITFCKQFDKKHTYVESKKHTQN
eukprot:TRINITY_DN6705_c0_g2_i5.p1 TRINITY_DN6705_c0_g2~~TRINITY_DN6705_c0_g2_i5.p1  ORF type:complete len:209 (+),score=-20.08 TRINITY_DN6705_c0_g2_i5:526-1152(+)